MKSSMLFFLAAGILMGCTAGTQTRSAGGGPGPGETQKATGDEPKPHVNGATTHPRRDFHLYVVDGMWKLADGMETYIISYVAYNDKFEEAPKDGKLPPPQIPGPAIRVTVGDEVHVFMHNMPQTCSHPQSGIRKTPHTIHFHGLDLVQSMDGVPDVPPPSDVVGTSIPPLAGVPEGGVFEYKFIAEHEGTCLYHCHVDSTTHILLGLYGAFIVEGPEPNTIYGHHYDREYTLVLSEMDSVHNEAIKEQGKYDMLKWKSDYFLLNGRIFTAELGNPLSTINDPNTALVANEGETVLLRLIAVGYGHQWAWHPHAYHMQVIGTDGRALDSPYWKDTLCLSSGERYDVLVPIQGKKNMACPSCGLGKGISIVHDHNLGGMVSTGKYPRGALTIFVVK